MKYLAVDLGDRRTGIAVGDDELNIAHPVKVLEVPIGNELINSISQLLQEHDIDAVVLGLPLNMDGSEGNRATLTRSFGGELQEATHCTVIYQDERLTSVAAEEHLRGSGKTHLQKKKMRDALAAAEILNDFLQANQSSK